MFSSFARPSRSTVTRLAAIAAAAAAVVLTLLLSPTHADPGGRSDSPDKIDSPNHAGVLRSMSIDGQPFDVNNPFFQSLGTNGRSCVSCHVPAAAWTITPAELQRRFDDTDGLDPIFRLNDGANSPKAKVATVKQRRDAYSMLLTRGVIRVGLPIPATAEFELVGADDPYHYASAPELSLFRRPLPATNLRFLNAIMWDGRESFGPLGTTPFSVTASPAQNLEILLSDLMHQADDATTGHAQGIHLTPDQQADIVRFEMNLVTAQRNDHGAGSLWSNNAQGGPAYLMAQPYYVTINDVLGADVDGDPFDSHSMTLFDAWSNDRDPHRAAIARGAALFGDPRINITGVGGLNDALGAPVIRGSCTTCHDAPNVGNHSVPLPIDIGITDSSRRTPDQPLYTLRNKSTGQLRRTTDPGRALLTGKWADIGKFKGPVLRGLAARPPYFHDGSAASLEEAIEFYDTRFNIGFTKQEKADLAAFLKAL